MWVQVALHGGSTDMVLPVRIVDDNAIDQGGGDAIQQHVYRQNSGCDGKDATFAVHAASLVCGCIVLDASDDMLAGHAQRNQLLLQQFVLLFGRIDQQNQVIAAGIHLHKVT